MNEEHFHKLERMYLFAPINKFYSPTIKIQEGAAEISMGLKKEFHHAANAVHGSVYFKILDDTAFFAANSLVEEYFVVTQSFHIHFLRPLIDGTVTAAGRVTSRTKNTLVAEAELFNDKGKKVGMGRGHFAISKMKLSEKIGYI